MNLVIFKEVNLILGGCILCVVWNEAECCIYIFNFGGAGVDRWMKLKIELGDIISI